MMFSNAKRTRSVAGLGLTVVLLGAGWGCGGCESDEKKSMNDPLTPGDAMKANDQMQGRADELMREYHERNAEPPPPIQR